MKFGKNRRYNLMHSIRFFKYFLSYMILLSIIISLLGFIVYKNFIETLKKEVEASNISSLRQIMDTMDMRVKEMNLTAIQIYSNPMLRAHKAMASNYDSLEAVMELKKYKSSNEFLNDIIVYHDYNEKQRFFSTKRDSDLDIFFNYLYIYDHWDSITFKNQMKALLKPEIKPLENIMVERSVKVGYSIYIYPLSINAYKSNSAVLFMIEETALKKLVGNVLKDYEGYIYILDEGGNQIAGFAEGNSKLEPKKVLEAVKQKPLLKQINNIGINDENYSVISITSEYNGWSYITVMRTNQLMKKVYTTRNLLIYAFFIVLVLGIVLAFSLAIGNYKPLREIADMILKHYYKENGSPNRYKDELALITNTINEVSRENLGLMTQLKSKAGMLKEQLLTRLLKKGSYNIDEVEGLCEMAGIRLKHACFTVLVLHVDDPDESKADINTDLESFLKFSIINVIEELSLEMGAGYGVELEDDRRIALLLNFNEQYAKERYISELAFKTKDFFKQHFGITMTIGIGSTVNDMTEIHKSYKEAKRAVYYRLIKGRGNIIFYEDIREIQNKLCKYPSDKEKEMIMAIKQGKSSEVERITMEFKAYLIEQKLLPESVQYICFGLINSIVKTLEEMNIEINLEFETEKEYLFVKPFETIDDMGDRIIGFCRKVCAYIEKGKESKNFDLRDKILDIIQSRYFDSSLSLESISEECGMSAVYISRYFKDQTGDTLMRYIDMIRMEKAKELLRDTNFVIRDILIEVGYVDESNFMRKFKKMEGMTPTQYRSVAKRGSGG